MEDGSSSDAPVSREVLNAVLLGLICVCHAGTFHPNSLFALSAQKSPFNCTLAAKVVFVRIFRHTETVAAGVPVNYSLKCGSKGREEAVVLPGQSQSRLSSYEKTS